VSDEIDVLFDGFRPAGILDINAGKPAGGFVRMDKFIANVAPGRYW